MIVSPLTEIIRIVYYVPLLKELFIVPGNFPAILTLLEELFIEKACEKRVPEGRQYGIKFSQYEASKASERRHFL